MSSDEPTSGTDEFLKTRRARRRKTDDALKRIRARETVEQLHDTPKGSGLQAENTVVQAEQLLESAKEVEVGSHVETDDDTDSNVESEVGTSSTYPNESVHDNEATADPTVSGTKAQATRSSSASTTESAPFESKKLCEYTERTEIERGEFGVIFKARHKIDKGWYTIKQVGPVDAVDVADTEQSPNKVLREVHILAKLDHPHIVRYYDAWMEKPPLDEKFSRMDSNQPCLYIRMEFCDGSTLHKWLRENRLPAQRPISQTLDWFRQLVSAVKHIHDKKMIHRDIKPGNIFFGSSRDGVASVLKIGGFGVATYAAASSSSGATRSIVGTEMYMSPEQPSGDYTNSTDIFSLGLVFLEMVHSFKTNRERCGAFGTLQLEKRPAVMNKLNGEIDTLISRMTAFEPKKRPTASELDNELEKKRGETNVNVELHRQFEIPDGSTGYGYDRVFEDYLDEKLTSVRVKDPYIRELSQVQNFVQFYKLLLQKCENLKRITLITSEKSRKNEESIKKELGPLLTERGIMLDFDYHKNLHDREIYLDNGWTVRIDRGLDYFNKLANPSSGDTDDMNHRACKATTIIILRHAVFSRV